MSDDPYLVDPRNLKPGQTIHMYSGGYMIAKLTDVDLFWLELSHPETDHWITVNAKGSRYVNHVIRMVAGLLSQKRMNASDAEILLDRLYAILESKL